MKNKLNQVDFDHYKFINYFSKRRWISIWHQLEEVSKKMPKSILEVGHGTGIFKIAALHFGLEIKTVDIDLDLKPDCCAQVTSLPFKSNTYDCICAFQVLEHIPYEQSLLGFREMVRVSKKYIILSLPDAKKVYTLVLPIPKIGVKRLLIPKIELKKDEHYFDGQHYWEVNKRFFPLKKIVDDFNKLNVKLTKTYRVEENPYHRFFIFEKI